jgi:hypothetical protein
MLNSLRRTCEYDALENEKDGASEGRGRLAVREGENARA